MVDEAENTEEGLLEPEEVKKNTNLAVDEAAEEKQVNILDQLFGHGNRLLTLPGSSLVINDDTRRLLALFSDGTFLVSESHKFDGRVLSFEVLARKKKLSIGKPRYVSQNELNAIYAFGERNQPISENDEDLNQLQMQKDFVNVVARAASQKVSDIHIVVADSTQIMFRVNGMMQTEMEYNKEWGESFVRAAFASADISDANYAQNEFQGAQKLGSTPLRGSKGKLMLPHNVLAIRPLRQGTVTDFDLTNTLLKYFTMHVIGRHFFSRPRAIRDLTVPRSRSRQAAISS